MEFPGNEMQRETFDILLSQIDNLQIERDEYSTALIFSGDGIDGPSVGYIETDGSVEWVTQG